MEKLIELLNKFEKARIEKINSEGKLFVKLAFKPYTKEILTNKAYRDCWSEICSKYYGFIKYLIDNDKIDFSRDGKYCEKSIEEFDGLLRADEDSLIMILAIQDKPIDFLISILK